MKPASRPGIFKGRHSDPELILCAVRGYLRSSLPFSAAIARLCARGLQADHATFWRWVQRYGLRARRRRPLTPDQRVDETTVRVKGRWCYLYRAINATGTTIDFGPDLATASQDLNAERRRHGFFRRGTQMFSSTEVNRTPRPGETDVW